MIRKNRHLTDNGKIGREKIMITYNELLTPKKYGQPSIVAKKEIEEMYKSLMECYHAQEGGRKVLIISDFDCDGICSALILKKIFPDAGVVIGDREQDGYDIPSNLSLEENKMVICSDLGSTSFEKLCDIAYITKIVPFVIDHHEISDDMIDDGKIVYPSGRMLDFNTLSYDTEEKRMINFTRKEHMPDYCATGLCYKIFEEYAQEYDVSGKDINFVKALAAIGTVADMVAVNNSYDDNASIILAGIDTIRQSSEANMPKGLHEFLKKCSKVFGVQRLSSTDIRFNVVPVINAMGQLEKQGGFKAYSALNMTEEDFDESKITEMFKINEIRIDMKKAAINTAAYDQLVEGIAYKRANNTLESPIAMFYNESIPAGIAGLLAGELAESAGVPAICFAKKENGIISAFGRNVKGYPNMFNQISALNEQEAAGEKLLEAFGGHSDALGFSFKEKNLDKVVGSIEELYKGVVKGNYLNTPSCQNLCR